MVNYRDYGNLDDMARVYVEVQPHYSQVFRATHNRAGKFLPYMTRSFMSFSYGGRNIEEFELIAQIENNSLNRQAYANFTDNITESDVYDGQIYWSSHYDDNNIQFSLVTDGMTEEQLDDFKSYFTPGKIEELILSEHPNRGIMARIKEPPALDLLPFETTITTKIMREEYEISTTLYKGKITLNFVMDDPFWYSRTNILDLKPDGTYNIGKWMDPNGNWVSILESKDALKIIHEDGVPFTAMSIDEVYYGIVPSAYNMIDYSFSPSGSRIGNIYNQGALIDVGHIFYVVLNPEFGIDIGPNDYGYFYYAGNAPEYPKLVFSITPTLNSSGYIDRPLNSFVNGITPYNKIILETDKQREFHFTTPCIWTGYNQVISIFNREDLVGKTWEEVREAIRDTVKHWAPRQYANYVINSEKGSTTTTTTTLLANCVLGMQNFLKNNADEIAPAIFTIDCKNSKAIAQVTFRKSLNDIVTSSVENAGDMVRSNYLILDEKNILNSDGYVDKWQVEHKNYSYRVWADCVLNNFNMQYKYRYF